MIPGIDSRSTRGVTVILVLCITVASAGAWIVVIWGSWHGIDLTDEGYYLNSISHPFSYKSSYSQFGFLLHPIYILVDGNLILLRLAGVLLLTSAATAFVSTFLKLPVIDPTLPQRPRLVITIGTSCAVLLYYSEWIPTPSYNLLNLFGVLIAFIGWFRVLARAGDTASKSWHPFVAIVTLALGIALVALVKPTTAAAVGVGITVLTLPFGRRALTDVLIAGASSFLFFSLVMLAIDGSPSVVVSRYRGALLDNQIAQSGHDLTGLFNSFDRKLGAKLLVGLFVAYLFGRSTQNGRMHRRYIAVLAALILTPLAIAFGTNTGISLVAARAGIFWIAATGLVAVAIIPLNARIPLLYLGVSIAAFGVFSILLHAVNRPYRVNGPLQQQTEWISSAFHERAVKVDPATADYFRTLLSGAESAGLQIRTPILDMTGFGPTTIYMLGGEAIGLAWISTGYPGSRDLALRALSSVPAGTLQRSWILTAPLGHDSLPIAILADVGLDFPNGYVEVTSAITSITNETHILWRPRIKQSSLQGLRSTGGYTPATYSGDQRLLPTAH
jgi:hypothetical protein